eukprot:CAMPEP_0195104746 /NCGR_PEP_ID=MMETSP0448-20130528/73649_1 /TAXON_ID=66468 /ORGANISM="Heterocapsa triquestra, Strain CCMP 448" /LENGTH=36 /DNA_ID= /DNA_START= /DNA_END= /DNA_ORIENTATION=
MPTVDKHLQVDATWPANVGGVEKCTDPAPAAAQKCA